MKGRNPMELQKRTLTCIICPRGCRLSVEIGESVTVSGNLCPRGKKYATDEVTDPKRTVTSTVRCSDGSVLSVKTDRAIPKGKMEECMRLINTIVAPLPVQIGTVLAEHILGTEANLVATQNKADVSEAK